MDQEVVLSVVSSVARNLFPAATVIVLIRLKGYMELEWKGLKLRIGLGTGSRKS